MSYFASLASSKLFYLGMANFRPLLVPLVWWNWVGAITTMYNDPKVKFSGLAKINLKKNLNILNFKFKKKIPINKKRWIWMKILFAKAYFHVLQYLFIFLSTTSCMNYSIPSPFKCLHAHLLICVCTNWHFFSKQFKEWKVATKC
jgi:hypothetical protein